MSYILDALKKSEQERGHGNIPDVQTVHSSSLNYRNDKKVYWPYILIGAVILNLLAISYFIFNKDKAVETIVTSPDSDIQTQAVTKIPGTTETEPEVISSTKTTAVSPLPESTAKADYSQPATTVTTEDTNIAEPPAEQAVSETTATPVEINGSDIPEFHELPESIRQQIPTITISAHVYSSNPLQRSVVINNNFMEEGEYVLDGLILYEITKNGAIFNFQGTLFNYGVVSGWQ